MADKPVICVTPIKNEEWILDRFIKCTLTWADEIVIADQGSSDKSVQIARSFPHVTVIRNESGVYDEGERQRLLLKEARKISTDAIIFALDADEFLSANVLTSPEWKSLLQSPRGTAIALQPFNVAGRDGRGWMTGGSGVLGFVDDGSAHQGTQIHSVRVPVSETNPKLSLQEIVLLHYQYVDWNRMRSKHRWYECWEVINHPDRPFIKIYRQYHHMDSIDPASFQPMKEEWLHAYEKAGIDMTFAATEDRYWWDDEVYAWMKKYGAAKFKRCDIWYKDWNTLKPSSEKSDTQLIRDPRSAFDKAMQYYLRLTQGRHHTFLIKAMDRFLRIIW
ncbi:MAG TPA: glycosyltransferase family 2 protein [Bacteroidota bacterium]|nr:glycosyltransferase family 2 protein [Bacteroidota bacterium]